MKHRNILRRIVMRCTSTVGNTWIALCQRTLYLRVWDGGRRPYRRASQDGPPPKPTQLRNFYPYHYRSTITPGLVIDLNSLNQGGPHARKPRYPGEIP